MARFGREQAQFELNLLRRLTFQLIGNPHAGARLRLRSLRQALDFLQASYGLDLGAANVLDAGSGKGEYSFYLARRYPGVSVTGYELDGRKVERADRIARALRTDHTRFLQEDLLRLPRSEEFDLAICLDVLEHIEDDQAAIVALSGAMKPGGYLILHVPNLVRPHFHIEEEGHVRDGYDNEAMRLKLKQAGFEVLQIRNPIGLWGQWADDLCEVLSERPFLRGLGIPLYAGLVWLDQFGSQSRQFPEGAGLLAVARKPIVPR